MDDLISSQHPVLLPYNRTVRFEVRNVVLSSALHPSCTGSGQDIGGKTSIHGSLFIHTSKRIFILRVLRR